LADFSSNTDRRTRLPHAAIGMASRAHCAKEEGVKGVSDRAA
jgi:hypothetical protein